MDREERNKKFEEYLHATPAERRKFDLSFLNEPSLPEGLNEELEIAAGEYAGLYFDRQTEYKSFWRSVDTFKAGAEWMKEQILKEAEECELYYDGDFLAIDLNMAELGYSERDKVRVIILREEEQ